MSVLALPSPMPWRTVSFRLRTTSFSHVGFVDGDTQTVQKPGTFWMLEAALAVRTRADGADVMAWLTELDGPAGRFHAGDPLGGTPRGDISGSTPLVNGAAQTGKTLVTDGWNAGGSFLKNDYFAIDLPLGGRSLHHLVADAVIDGGGNATLSFRPALRESPAENAALIISSATCSMRLIDDNQAAWEESVDGFYRMGFSAIESFNTG